MNEQELNAYLDELAEEAMNTDKNDLLNPEAHKQKLKEEFRHSFDTSSLQEKVQQAVDVLQKDLTLEGNTRDFFILDLSSDKPSSSSIDIIEKMAIEKFHREEYLDAKKLFELLCILDGRESHYQKLGICHIDLKDYPAAVEAFLTALEINDKSVENWIFLAECYFAIQDYERVSSCCSKAEEFLESSPDREVYEELLNALKHSH